MVRPFAARQSTQAAPRPLRSSRSRRVRGSPPDRAARRRGRAPRPVRASTLGTERAMQRTRIGQLGEQPQRRCWGGCHGTCMDTERHQERAARADRGRLVRSAIGHVERDLEAKAQVNRRRSHPCHSRSPVFCLRREHCRSTRASMSSGSRRCNHAAPRCASCASL